jgi:predicted dienelactone hydrolase
MRRKVCALVLVLAGVASPTGSAAGAVSIGDPPGRTPPGADGPYEVGLTTFTAADPARPGRALTMDVWYPSDAGSSSGSPASLDLLVTDIALPGVRRDADVAPGERFPLVVFSHGSGGVRFQSWFLLQALASHGYVVVAPDHAGNTSLDLLMGTSEPFPVVASNRPRDVSFAIDQMLARSSEPTDLLAGAVDGSRIAVAGHSFGGFTALAVAGGYGGLAPDERVDAIIPIAAASGALSDAELAAVDVPTLLLAGVSDETVPLDAAAERPWAEISGSPAWRVDVDRAGHNSFTNVCDLLDALVGAGLPPTLLAFLVSSAEEACAPSLIPIEDAHRLTVQYSLAFLRTTIGHDSRWQHYLAAQWAERNGLPVTVLARPAGQRRAG